MISHYTTFRFISSFPLSPPRTPHHITSHHITSHHTTPHTYSIFSGPSCHSLSHYYHWNDYCHLFYFFSFCSWCRSIIIYTTNSLQYNFNNRYDYKHNYDDTSDLIFNHQITPWKWMDLQVSHCYILSCSYCWHHILLFFFILSYIIIIYILLYSILYYSIPLFPYWLFNYWKLNAKKLT